MRRIGRIPALSAALLVFFMGNGGAVFSQMAREPSSPADRDEQGEHHRKHKENADRQPGRMEGPQTVCANDVPHGWIRTGDRWDPMSCGKPTSISYNVWTIEKYRGRPAGSIMRVCSGPVPRGWVLLDAMWNPSTCGHPTVMEKNVMTIKKIE